ncbi:MAG: peptidoglycan binding domain-containing protein [Lachnospiraceae bacterium]|nr:peptidoglycan binding domain-containing protein [Lachnospiraceae bacterium]
MDMTRVRAREWQAEKEKERKKEIERKKKRKKILFRAGIGILLLLLAGLGVYGYQTVRNMIGLHVSVYGKEISRQTPSQAAKRITKAFGDKKIIFYEDGERVYETKLSQLGYSLDQEALEQSLEQLREQNRKSGKQMSQGLNEIVPYQIKKDDAVFSAALTVEHFKIDSERFDSVSAYMEYSEEQGKFVIVNDIQGNRIDMDKLKQFVEQSLDENFKEELLGANVIMEVNRNVYVPAVVTAESEELNAKVQGLNQSLEKYKNTSITYTLGAATETIDSDTICSWLIISDDTVQIDTDKPWAYIEDLSTRYNTIYAPRSFVTTGGQTVEISNNEYGYQINQDAEFEQLRTDLESGMAIRRDPVYEHAGYSRNGTDDLNGCYIEVSLSQQHLWLYKDGGLVTETAIISGLPTKERETLTGAWPIAYKASPFNLTSDVYGYDTKVNYWMPFVYGQGLHDASWQTAIGGETYRTNGSHGCINLPPDQAALIYNTIEGGYPIIIY